MEDAYANSTGDDSCGCHVLWRRDGRLGSTASSNFRCEYGG